MSSSATRIATGACSIASPRRTLCTNGSETLTEGMYRAGLRSPSAPSSNTCAALLDESLMRRPGWAPDVLSLFLELAALPSPSGEERAVADRVLDYLHALGIEAGEDDAGPKIGSSMGNILCSLGDGADNKAAVAAMLEAAARLLEDGRPHSGIELLFTPKEEVGLVGATAFDESR